MNFKNCTECFNDFIPSSRHKKCPTCRYREYKDMCKCGEIKARTSKTCNKCSKVYSRNNNWKGGKTKHKKGYVQVRCTNHPNAVGGYVFEHRLIMEDYLGRYLLKNENIHHKNGVKDDNRIENLELWVVTQPCGQRASDLVAWAKSIIELYDSDSSAPTDFNQ
jgi:hypothetical protein